MKDLHMTTQRNVTSGKKSKKIPKGKPCQGEPGKRRIWVWKEWIAYSTCAKE